MEVVGKHTVWVVWHMDVAKRKERRYLNRELSLKQKRFRRQSDRSAELGEGLCIVVLWEGEVGTQPREMAQYERKVAVVFPVRV